MTGVPPPQVQQQPQAQPQQQNPPGGLVGKIPEGARPLAAVGALGGGFLATAVLDKLAHALYSGLKKKWGADVNIGSIDPFFYGGGAVALLQGLMRRRWTDVVYTGAISQMNNLYKLAVETGYELENFGRNATLQLGIIALLYGVGRAFRGRN